MKKLVCLLLVTLLMMSICGCSNSNSVVEKPNTNLEFWITESVDGIDFSEYDEKIGLIGGKQYYGKGYNIDDSNIFFAKEYVLYTVSAYPDYSSETKHITSIEITDPSVHIYGLTRNSSAEDVVRIMKENGYKFIGDATDITYKKDKVTITFSDKGIFLNVKTTNIWGIVY